MAKKIDPKQTIEPDGPAPKVPRWRTWDASHATYLAGRAEIDGADHLGAEMDRKWGIDRLRLLVDADMRLKFDRQRYKYNAALQHGELQEVIDESNRMKNAWMALDRAAEAAGALKLDPAVWELQMLEGPYRGSVVALVQSNEEASQVIASGRWVQVYTLGEIGRLLEAMPMIVAVKETFPGATVIGTRAPDDPLDAIRHPGNFEDNMEDPNDPVLF